MSNLKFLNLTVSKIIIPNKKACDLRRPPFFTYGILKIAEEIKWKFLANQSTENITKFKD